MLWWLVAELNFELSDYVILCFPKKESDLDTHCTYIDNDFHFYYRIVWMKGLLPY